MRTYQSAVVFCCLLTCSSLPCRSSSDDGNPSLVLTSLASSAMLRRPHTDQRERHLAKGKTRKGRKRRGKKHGGQKRMRKWRRHEERHRRKRQEGNTKKSRTTGDANNKHNISTGHPFLIYNAHMKIAQNTVVDQQHTVASSKNIDKQVPGHLSLNDTKFKFDLYELLPEIVDYHDEVYYGAYQTQNAHTNQNSTYDHANLNFSTISTRTTANHSTETLHEEHNATEYVDQQNFTDSYHLGNNTAVPVVESDPGNYTSSVGAEGGTKKAKPLMQSYFQVGLSLVTSSTLHNMNSTVGRADKRAIDAVIASVTQIIREVAVFAPKENDVGTSGTNNEMSNYMIESVGEPSVGRKSYWMTISLPYRIYASSAHELSVNRRASSYVNRSLMEALKNNEGAGGNSLQRVTLQDGGKTAVDLSSVMSRNQQSMKPIENAVRSANEVLKKRIRDGTLLALLQAADSKILGVSIVGKEIAFFAHLRKAATLSGGTYSALDAPFIQPLRISGFVMFMCSAIVTIVLLASARLRRNEAAKDEQWKCFGSEEALTELLQTGVVVNDDGTIEVKVFDGKKGSCALSRESCTVRSSPTESDNSV